MISTKIKLSLIFLLGLVLRLITSKNFGVFPDDMAYAPQAVNILNSGILQTYAGPSLWHYTTDVIFKILGVSQLTSRSLGILFGSLLIILVFMIARIFLDEKTSLLASFLVAISPMVIKIGSLAEMDVPMIFFILLSQYLLFQFIYKKSYYYLVFSSLFFGVAIMFKLIAVTFLPAYFLIFLYFSHKNKSDFKIFNKRNLKILIIFGLISFMFIIPPITHNYLLYRDSGYLDFQFARFLGESQEVYANLGGIDEKFDFKTITGLDGTTPGAYRGLKLIFDINPLLLIFGLTGLILSFYRKKKLFHYVWPCLLFTFVFVAEATLLGKHFVFTIPYLAICTSYLIFSLNKKFSKVKIGHLIIILLILSSSFILFSKLHIHKTDPVGQLMDYKAEHIPPGSFIFVDDRIYRGQITWIFNDMNYLEANYAIELLNNYDTFKGETIADKVYLIECTLGDCGWGLIEEGGNLDQQMDNFFEVLLKQDAIKLKEINGINNEPHFAVYEMPLEIKEDMVLPIKSTHVWFFNPVRYKDMSNYIFSYETHGVFTLMNNFAFSILYFAIFLTLIAPLFLIYYFYKGFK